MDVAGSAGRGIRHRVESILDDAFHERSQARESMCGELGTDETAQPGVIGGIGHSETAGILIGREATTARPDCGSRC